MTVRTLPTGFCLPTVCSSYRPIEEYLAYRAGPAVVDLRPLDALLLHLLAALQPAQGELLDLAADATGGASTVLGLTLPSVRHVVSPCAGTAEGWPAAVDRYRKECDPPPAAEWVRAGGAPPAPARPRLVLAAWHDGEEPGDRFGRWFGNGSPPVVLVLGLGELGDCPGLTALAAACGADSDRRLVLPREWAPALAASRLGVVGPRGDAAFDETVFRARQFFADPFRHHDLLRRACANALEQASAAGAQPAAAETGDEIDVDPSEQVLELERALEGREREIEALHKMLRAMTGSVAYRLAHRARRTLGLVAPEGSHRRWWVQKLLGAIRVFRRAGLRGVATKTVSKLTRRPLPLASPPDEGEVRA
jgi:hypothetical protein